MSNTHKTIDPSLVEASASPVKIAVDPNTPPTEHQISLSGVSVKQILMVISLIQQAIAFIEGPTGQRILDYIRESAGQPLKDKMRIFAQRLLAAADGHHAE